MSGEYLADWKSDISKKNFIFQNISHFKNCRRQGLNFKKRYEKQKNLFNFVIKRIKVPNIG